MTHATRWQRILAVALLMGVLLLTAQPALAADAQPRILPITGPRTSPHPIPHTSVINPEAAVNAPQPPQVAEANQVYATQPYYQPGAGVIGIATNLANGQSLYPTAYACNDFNQAWQWASSVSRKKSDIWSDWYAGWGPFALDGGLYQAKNTVFALERTIGPGHKAGPNQYSVKISSYQPFAGGFGSPIIQAKPGAAVVVTAKYLLWDYVQNVDPAKVPLHISDWASLGFKPDAALEPATYVNGYIHGQWAEMKVTGTVGATGQMMVLLQGQSTKPVNANVYFDDITIMVDGQYLADCTHG